MPLNDTRIRNAKSEGKTQKLSDERGLYLELAPKGGKWWRLKYRFEGRENRLSLGTYPDVSLQAARRKRDEARALLADGVDPSAQRKAMKAAGASKAASSFEIVAREWFVKYSANWVEAHSSRVIRLFERDIFPWLGSRPIADISAPDLLAVVRKIEARAVETAHRALANCGQVFRYAIATGRCSRDPSADLKGALPPVRGSHFAATTEPKQLGAILRAMDGYSGTHVVRCALQLAPLVFVRPGELRRAEWKDFDLDSSEWRYFVAKTRVNHIVPLSRQALEILREVHPITGAGRYVFPSARSNARPMSDNAILAALRRMGVEKREMTAHGLRAVARTILDEVLGVRPDFIEHQLAHAVRDVSGRAYNRTSHIAERHVMMQTWADYLDSLKTVADVIPIRQRA